MGNIISCGVKNWRSVPCTETPSYILETLSDEAQTQGGGPKHGYPRGETHQGISGNSIIKTKAHRRLCCVPSNVRRKIWGNVHTCFSFLMRSCAHALAATSPRNSLLAVVVESGCFCPGAPELKRTTAATLGASQSLTEAQPR